MRAAAITAVIVLASVSAVMGNLVANGSFETGACTIYYSGQSLAGWTVGPGSSIDVVGYWKAADGGQCVDLSGGAAGSVFQDVQTIAAGDYTLRFAMAGNPDLYDGTIKSLKVVWEADGPSRLDRTLFFDTTGRSPTNMGWVYHEFTVRATAPVTKLWFYSLTDNPWGPTLDDVSVTLVPEPASMVLLVLGGFLLMTRRVRRIGAVVIPVVAAALFLSATPARAVNIETVPVGNPGNARDMRYGGSGRGSVGYTYNIGKYEITAGQYCEFLNKVAATDTYGLYVTAMWSNSYGCQIQRGGTSGSYTYSVAPEYADRPVNFVSFWDACRFANWLHNGQPTGAQGADTTETGAYTLTTDGTTFNTVTRSGNWKWAVTSENEWYKAAYYKAGSSNAGYWDYPTSSNNVNTAMANYNWSMGHTTNIGFYAYPSAYGSFDQGGNVYEWNEGTHPNQIGRRGVRGGSFNELNSNYLSAQYGTWTSAAQKEIYIGFRVVQVPEPSSLLLLAFAGLAMMRRIRRAR